MMIALALTLALAAGGQVDCFASGGPEPPDPPQSFGDVNCIGPLQAGCHWEVDYELLAAQLDAWNDAGGTLAESYCDCRNKRHDAIAGTMPPSWGLEAGTTSTFADYIQSCTNALNDGLAQLQGAWKNVCRSVCDEGEAPPPPPWVWSHRWWRTQTAREAALARWTLTH